MSDAKPKPKPKKYKYPGMTSIAISKQSAKILKELKRGNTYDDVLQRLFNHQVDVYVEFILIDNELPQIHTAVFQLGEDKESLYFWDGEKLTPTTLEAANKLMKRSKPSLTIPENEVGIINQLIHARAFHQDSSNIEIPNSLITRIINFNAEKQKEMC